MLYGYKMQNGEIMIDEQQAQHGDQKRDRNGQHD